MNYILICHLLHLFDKSFIFYVHTYLILSVLLTVCIIRYMLFLSTAKYSPLGGPHEKIGPMRADWWNLYHHPDPTAHSETQILA